MARCLESDFFAYRVAWGCRRGTFGGSSSASWARLIVLHYSVFKVHSGAWRTRPRRAQGNGRTPTEREPNLGARIQGLVFRCDFDEISVVSEQVAIYSMGARASSGLAADKNEGRHRLQNTHNEVEQGYPIGDDKYLRDGPDEKEDACHEACAMPCGNAFSTLDESNDVGHAVYQQKCEARPEMAREEHVV